MGEGSRRDRSSRRHRVNVGSEKSSSDTEITGGSRRSSAKNRKGGPKKKRERLPFLEGLTVDELARYRRRRIENHHPWNDAIAGGSPYYYQQQRGSNAGEALLPLVTEYQRAFRAISEDSFLAGHSVLEQSTAPKTLSSLVLDNPTSVQVTIEPLIAAESTESQEIKSPIGDEEPRSAMKMIVSETADQNRADNNDNNDTGPELIPRVAGAEERSLTRRQQEFNGRTESSCYVAHTGNHRAELARRPTSLRMEGNMADGRSEQCDKFIEWINVTRPELVRKSTNLKLEGDIETTTENHAKYVPFIGARRPELLRQRAHLKLEGEQSTFIPEYTDVFRQHHIAERRMPLLPENHLKIGGNLYENTENSRAHGDSTNTEIFGDTRLDERYDASKETADERDQNNGEKDTRMLESKLSDSIGPMALLEIPEYKDAYKNFPRERPKLIKPEDVIGRADGSKELVHRSGGPAADAKFHTKIDRDLEYCESSLIGSGRDGRTTVYSKPPLSLSKRPPISRGSLDISGRIGSRRQSRRRESTNACQVSRGRDVSYGGHYQHRVSTPRLDALETMVAANPHHTEGATTTSIDPLNYEYYRTPAASREPSPMTRFNELHRHQHRRLNSVGASPIRAGGPAGNQHQHRWINNAHGSQFRDINAAANDQDAFQLVSTRIHEDSIVGKPLSAGLFSGRATRLDTAMSGTPALTRKNRSFPDNSAAAADFRLSEQRVYSNVGDEPRGLPDRSSRRSSVYSSLQRADERIPKNFSSARTGIFRLSPADNNKGPPPHRTAADVYSPSFGGKSCQQQQQQRGNLDDDDHAFFVLDDAGGGATANGDNLIIEAPFNPAAVGNCGSVEPRKLVQRNYNNITGSQLPSLPGGRRPPSRTPTNWMLPWYDNNIDGPSQSTQGGSR